MAVVGQDAKLVKPAQANDLQRALKEMSHLIPCPVERKGRTIGTQLDANNWNMLERKGCCDAHCCRPLVDQFLQCFTCVFKSRCFGADVR